MKSKGFTLMEILIAIAILAIAITIVTLSFSKLNERKALEGSALNVITALSQARALALSGSDATQYGVRFENDRIILFKGGIYSGVDPENVETLINPLVGIQDIILSGGGSDVVFQRLTGKTNQSGTIEVYLRGDPAQIRTITISATGIAE